MSGRWRSLLFVPGGRTELLAKVERCRPDAVALDLEDAVAPEEKVTARKLALAGLAGHRPGAGTVLIRVNPPGSPWHEADVAAVAEAMEANLLDGLVLPKYEYPEQLDDLRAALPSTARIVVGVETALGVADARVLLAGETVAPDAVYFGAEDFVADMGGRRTVGGAEVAYARSRVVLAARLGGVAALDQAVLAIRDADAFGVDAAAGRDLGYVGKICLHPTQVEVAHEVFTPSEAEVAHARAVVQAVAAGVGVLDGAMVDGAHLRAARAVLVGAGESE
ncbi:MAG: HpcH/HpaI aldolase/citrate lyase family protein [Sporichthyaceae bacterium]